MVKTFSFRAQMIGDCIASLPILTAISKKYPNAYNIVGVAQKSKAVIPFLENQPLINEILLSDENEGDIFTYNGITWNQQIEKHPEIDYAVNLNPKVTETDFYNRRHIILENFRMCFGGEDEYWSLAEEERLPRLYKTFDIKKVDSDKKLIGFQSAAGFSTDGRRTPKVEWWQELIKSLPKYQFVQIGHFNDQKLDNAVNLTDLSLFEQFHYLLGCDAAVLLENGIGCLCAAYSTISQISLLSNWFGGSTEISKTAWSPLGLKTHNLWANSIHEVSIEEVQNKLDKILN